MGYTKSCESKALWYLCRRIPVTNLDFGDESSVPELISMNSNSLEEIRLEVTFGHEVLIALGNCSHLKKLSFFQCSFSDDLQRSSLLQSLTNLETLCLSSCLLSRSNIEVISHCQSLKYLELSFLNNLEDPTLRCLVEGCRNLRSLKLCALRISDESLRMLMSHHPPIPSIGIQDCLKVNVENIFSLLEQTTIPTFFQTEDEELQMVAIGDITFTMRSSYISRHYFAHFFANNFFLDRLVSLLSLKNQVRSPIISFIATCVAQGHHQLVVNSGAIPVLIQLFNSFSVAEKYSFLRLLHFFCSKNHELTHLLTSGVLSIFRPSLLQVRCDCHPPSLITS
jgi:hypothetical protein